VEDALRWRVGNGEKNRIWKDRWLPPPLSILIFSPHQGLEVNARVCSLLDSSTGWWNTQTIRENFTTKEVACIVSVIPSPQLGLDVLIWQGTPHGKFTMRSAYFQEQQRRHHLQGESSHAGEVESFWKAIWKGGSCDCGEKFSVETGK